MAAGKRAKRADSRNSVQKKPVKEIPFLYKGQNASALIDHQAQISFVLDGKPVNDPKIQDLLMKELIRLNRLPSAY